MKTLKLTEVLDVISQYCENHKGKHPMMLWFHSNSDLDAVKQIINNTPSYSIFIGHPLKLGHTSMVLNGETVKIASHPELVEKFIFPTTKNDSTRLFVYHKYIQQLDTEALQYCVDIVNLGKYPVVCLMNDYSLQNDRPTEGLLSFMNEYFDQYEIKL